jgi:hypothetical protein
MLFPRASLVPMHAGRPRIIRARDDVSIPRHQDTNNVIGV